MDHETNQDISLTRSKTSFVPRKKQTARRKGQLFTQKEEKMGLTLLAQGLSDDTIAAQLKRSAGAIKRLRVKYQGLIDALPTGQDYAVIKSGLINVGEFNALKSVIETVQDPAIRCRDAAFAFKVLHEAGRLERGLSTRNTESHHTYTRISID